MENDDNDDADRPSLFLFLELLFISFAASDSPIQQRQRRDGHSPTYHAKALLRRPSKKESKGREKT